MQFHLLINRPKNTEVHSLASQDYRTMLQKKISELKINMKVQSNTDNLPKITQKSKENQTRIIVNTENMKRDRHHYVSSVNNYLQKTSECKLDAVNEKESKNSQIKSQKNKTLTKKQKIIDQSNKNKMMGLTTNVPRMGGSQNRKSSGDLIKGYQLKEVLGMGCFAKVRLGGK